MAGPEETADFAALIREFKDRSGLSYGVLAKRLHMSTSTLHRYCNGDAVPTEYAPVERFARLCKATPDELVEAHRRWILADGARQRERKAAAGTAANTGTETGAGAGAGTPAASGPSATPTPTPTPDAPHPEPGEPPSRTPEPNATPDPTPRNTNRPRPRTTLLAATAVAVVLAATALVPRLVSGGDGGNGGNDRKQDAGAVTSTGHGASSPSDPAKSKAKATSSPSTSPSDSADPSKSAAARTGTSVTPGDKAGGGAATAAVPLTVTSRPYAWESPCSQTYLVDEDAAKVPPPPTEQDAPSWVSALGAVSADSQYLELTVQGTGQETVVLQSLNVRVVQSGAPLAWSAYTMGYVGVGCGGGVPTHSFDVGLDATRPVATAKAGQTGLPYKVSESDPEVLYVTAAAASHDVRWYLELNWTSGTRHGVLRIDDQGKPFHTSGMNGRPRYGYSLDDSEWVPHQGD
ncbi:helix-turn-helix domain-containing protein [Streptomyces sp. NBC_01261]|uniref:helix-turn-helix domain-containing protein n=1 Tax=unclassified Streptomyces TaxID=2593676 RepID=UPI002E2E0D52|nr:MULTISPECIES: helix-turn-helix transcriptional regulator [unclassified Streptomyces]